MAPPKPQPAPPKPPPPTAPANLLQQGDMLFVGVRKVGSKHTVQWGTISGHGAVTVLGQEKDAGMAVAFSKLMERTVGFIRRGIATGRLFK